MFNVWGGLRRIGWVLIVTVCVALILTSCSGTVGKKETSSETKGTSPTAKQETEKILKLGAAISLTGRLAKEGALLKDGYDFWRDYVNSAGGVEIGGLKHQVEIRYYDDKSDAQTSAKLTEKLITEDGIKLILGPYSSGVTQATSAIGEKYKAVTIASMANADSIYERGFKYTFSILTPASTDVNSFLDLVNTLLPKCKVAIITPDDLFPVYGAEGANRHAKEIGMEVVFYEKYPRDAEDLAPVLTQLKKSDPDILITTADLQQVILMVRQCKDLQIAPKMAYSISAEMPDFVKALGKDAENVFGYTWYNPTLAWKDPVFGSAAEYGRLFKQKYNYEPNYYSAAGSTAGVILQRAIQKAGSIDPEKVRDALAAIEEETIFGLVGYDERGRNVKGGTVVIQIQNGKPEIVFPEKVKQKEPKYPMTPWHKR